MCNPYFLILAAGSLWGITFSLVLIGSADGTQPMALATWQLIISAFAFMLICVLARTPFFRWQHFRHYVFVAIVGMGLPNFLYYNAAPHVSAGILSITVSTVPLFTYAIMLSLRFESLIFRRAVGIAFGMVAILFLVIPDHGFSSSDANFWILVVVICAICYAVENVYIARGINDHVDVRELLCGSSIIASLLLMPITLIMGPMPSPAWLLTSSGLAITGVAVISTIAYAIFFYTIKQAGAVFASQTAYIVTISGVLWGIALFAEQHTIWVWLSVIFVTVGLVLVTPLQRLPVFLNHRQ